jgi:chloramphenicol-sensitive protein RarD
VSINRDNSGQASSAGVIFALCGYGWWAVITPLYFHYIRDVHAMEQLAWRVVAGVPTILLFLMLCKRLGEVRSALRSGRVLRTLALSCVLIGINWFVFMYAIMTDRLSHASLGYYLSPLVSVLLARMVLGERLRKTQWAAVAMAAIGVAAMTLTMEGVPWIAIALALSFAFYGLVRKRVDAAPAPGLAIEMILLFPLMLAFLIFVQVQEGMTAMGDDATMTTLLILGGVQTMVPLIFFAAGARRLRLSTLGLLQYVSPTGQLLIAVLIFGEAFGTGRLVAFACIWAAVLVYSLDSLFHGRSKTTFDVSIPGEV